MIDLGTMLVRDQHSISEVREKVLGLARSLGCGEVIATRAATAVSEVSRRSLESCGGLGIRVEITGDEGARRLRMVFESGGAPIDSESLRVFFETVGSTGAGGGAAISAEMFLPPAAAVIDEHAIQRARERIARKSRHELMEELRAKNRQLEEYSESLEATVAERTVELRSVNARLQSDLDAGAAYVRALIPAPMRGPVSIDWSYVPSSNLGGDTIGYHWLDDDHLALYLIDVTGHGLDSALLAVTVTNVIRSGSLPGADMKRPEEVVSALNDVFQGDRHGLKYFTIWYGVYRVGTRRLTWSGGGHHPSVLLSGEPDGCVLLPASGPIMGAVPDIPFPAEACDVPAGSRLLIFSDGVFEILRDGRLVWNLEGVNRYLAGRAGSTDSIIEPLLEHVRGLRGSMQLDDDLSIMDVCFA